MTVTTEQAVEYADAKVRAAKLRALEHKLTNLINSGMSFNDLLDDGDLSRALEQALAAVDAVREKVRARAADIEAESFRVLRALSK